MIGVENITYAHIDATTYCNARCPQCVRNFYGWNEPINFPLVHLSYDKLESIVNQIPHKIDSLFCGNFGDPLMNPDLNKLITLFNHNIINTNGSIGTKDTWENLAISNTNVVFSIDGLEDTNHIYRQDVRWDAIMKRVEWFIQSGGTANWKFIVFEHNAHQIHEAEKRSKDMGFESFNTVNHGRDYGPILDDTGKEIGWLNSVNNKQHEIDMEYELELINNPIELNTTYEDYEIQCMMKNENSFYINPLGDIVPCCYIGSSLEYKSFGTTIQEQLNSYKYIQDGWNTKECLEKCAMECGKCQ